ncbi:hypothetical protein NLX71_13615 [Paenibacillus sp. MZ04-78.2]|uniref:hypothetical protein n=1 Tax=Paenibacillus sp. MZ04-78.2 TaxID=2962034 RepID=UPI0020B80132|nr:hypothetical protein [Paenibacillus sp. MZ04-78.2]MCP3774335.1 hypothetical protein [Paenibacillus sp. MZ04-78.2]
MERLYEVKYKIVTKSFTMRIWIEENDELNLRKIIKERICKTDEVDIEKIKIISIKDATVTTESE